MTVQEFKERIEKIEKLEKEIKDLRYFIRQIDVDSSAKVTVFSKICNDNVDYRFANCYVRKMALEQLETMMSNYNSHLETLKNSGVDIASAFKD